MNIDYKEIDIIFTLVIKYQQKEWLLHVQEALSRELNEYVRVNKIWKCKVIVLNEEQAAEKKFLLSENKANI